MSNPVVPENKRIKKIIATNRKARFNYSIEDTIQAGLVLHGSEVKSLRTKNVDFSDAYAHIDNGECILIGLHLTTYDKTHIEIPEPSRDRKLLLSKREIAKLQVLVSRSGYTIVPLELYFLGSFAKVLLGVGKGKTHGDKRQALKEKALKREE